MKKITFIGIVAACSLFASCMGDSYAGTNENDPSPYGVDSLKETNVVSIADLKSKFATYISTDYRDGNSYTKITDDIKIEGVVTSTDVQGNVYQEIALQDNTGAIIIAVAGSGLYGSVPPGTKLLVSLKDLYIGNYGLQAEIGVPTTNASGSTYVGRMPQLTWEKHYKILSTGNKVEPTEFDVNTWSLDKDGGKLGVLKNVSFKNTTSGSYLTFADPNGGAGSISWTLNEVPSSKVIVYNSNYSKFAADTVPVGKKVNITGIFKRFNNQWEIILRTKNDIQIIGDATPPVVTLAGTGDGTLASPYDVTRALSILSNGVETTKEVYVTGKIDAGATVSTKYHNADYNISANGDGNNSLLVFRGKGLNGAAFNSETELPQGHTVVLKGVLKNYQGTLELTNSSIVSIN